MKYEINGDKLIIWGSLAEYGVNGLLEVNESTRQARLAKDDRIRQHFEIHHELPDNPENL
jgi:hypothetical protein